MPTYDEVILADNPEGYWKIEELLAVDPLADSSGNAHDGEFYDSDPLPVLGLLGPIETDASPHAGSSRIGTISAPSGSALDLRGNFTREVWAYLSDTTGDHIALSRNGSYALNGSNVLGFNSGAAYSRTSVGTGAGNTFDLSSGLLAPGAWYHIVEVRNATVLTLYVNGEVVDDDITFPAGDIVYANYNNEDWAIGAGRSSLTGPGTAFYTEGVSRVALYPHALTGAEVLEHYEAALLALLLRGASNVIPTAILYSNIEPDPVHFPFRHNWADPLIERISFRTNIAQSRNGAEEGVATRLKPRREIEFVQVLRDNAERRRFRAKLWAHQAAKWFVPVLEDREPLASSVAIGALTIPASTQYKDYQVGGFVELRQLSDAGVIVKAEVLEIGAFDGTSITPITQPVNAYDALVATVSPARRAYIDAQSITGHTDAVEEVVITARLLAEDEPAVPNRITVWTPTLKYRDYEVFDPRVWQGNDWTEEREYEVERAFSDVDFDTGMFRLESDTVGAQEAFSYRMLLDSRASLAALLGWFYDRAGSLTYLWVPTMTRDFEVVSAAGDFLTVEGTDYSDNFALAEPRRDLAFVYNDGTMELRRVVGFSGTVNETLELDDAVPTLVNLRSVSLLKFCRLDADTLEIARVTDNKTQLAWRFRELLESPAGTGPSSLSPSASASVSRSPSASYSPSASTSPSISPSSSVSPSASTSPSGSVSPSGSASLSRSPSASTSPSASASASA